jgi:hypothetical protein
MLVVTTMRLLGVFFNSLSLSMTPILATRVQDSYNLQLPPVRGQEKAEHDTWMLQGVSVLSSCGIVPEVQYLGPCA